MITEAETIPGGLPVHIKLITLLQQPDDMKPSNPIQLFDRIQSPSPSSSRSFIREPVEKLSNVEPRLGYPKPASCGDTSTATFVVLGVML